MKLAVLADIHANLPALQTVIDHIQSWRPDLVVVDGDIVNRGPRPLECLALIQQKQDTEAWQVVRGNHEDYVINFAHPGAYDTNLEAEIYRSAYWTYQRLNGEVSALAAMPFQVELRAPDGSLVKIVHASVHNNRDGVFPKTSDDQLRHKIQTPDQKPPALFCTGHTHWPLIRHIDETLVVNAGSVGLPFDGDYRAAYAQLTWQQGCWQAEIIRLDYDRQQTEQDFFETGYLPDGGPVVELILDELRIARPHLFKWTMQYQDAIMAGQISIEAAVNNFLADYRARTKHIS